MKNCVVGKCPKKSKVVGKCPKLEVGKCPRKNRKLENILSYFFLTHYAFSTSPLELGHWEPETIKKSDSSHILNISPSIRSLGARENRKVGLVVHSGHLP